MRMKKDQSRTTERILNLTLEIIYLLTGERFPLVKSGDHTTITVPPCDSLKPKRHNMKKILEVTKKMMKLLTGEEDLEGHKDLYKDIMMENQPPLTSPDRSSNRNPRKRCPRPLYSRDSTQKGHTITHHHKYVQSENLGDDDIDVKVEEDGVMEEFSEGHKDVAMEPPERCPSPLFSRDSTEEDLNYVKPNQGKDLMIIKTEGDEEEEYVRDDQQYTEEAGMTRTFIEEDTPTEISTGHAIKKRSKKRSKKCSKKRLTLSPDYTMEDEDITGDCGGEKTMSSTMDGGLHSVDRPRHPSDSEQPRTVRDAAVVRGEEKRSCAELLESVRSELSRHENLDGEKMYSCPECGKCTKWKAELIIHQRSHTGERPYSCSECGNSFARNSALLRHLKIHRGDKYPCLKCKKSFEKRSQLDAHRKTHLKGMRYSCSECGKCFPQKKKLVEHEKSHTEEGPYSCPECGNCYLWKESLVKHQKSHTGERPYSCPECGKCFSVKSTLVRHVKTHTGEKQYICPECGKSFKERSHLYRHFKYHTVKKPCSCPECGKLFRWKSKLIEHQRSHTGEKPYSCPECEKCYSQKCLLDKHLKTHESKKT